MPGADLICKLKKELLTAQNRKHVPRRGQLVRKRPASYRELKAKRSDEYTGPEVRKKVKKNTHATRNPASKSAMPTSELTAYSALVDAGYLSKTPHRCPTCRCGALSEPYCSSGRVVVRCDMFGCQSYHNVIKFSNLKTLAERQRPGRGSTPMALHGALKDYTSLVSGNAARSSQVSCTQGKHKQAYAKLFQELRQLEADEAHCENKRIKLAGDLQTQKNVEGDGTVLRKMHVSAKNPHYQKEMGEALERLKRRGKLPARGVPHWTAHIRYAALCERGGRITIVALPMRLVCPGGPPPPEAFEELRDSKLLDRCHPRAYLFTDGAHSWPKLAKAHNKLRKTRLRLQEVAHYKGQYTRSLAKTAKDQSTIAGTQSLDSRWRWLKAYVPHSIKARIDRQTNAELDQYVFSYQFRANVKAKGENLWLELGKLVAKRKQ